MKWTPISESQPWMNTGSMPPKRGRVLVTVRRAHGKRAVEQVFYNASGRGLSVTPKPARSGAPILWPRRSKAGRKKGRKKTGFPLSSQICIEGGKKQYYI